MAQHETPYDIGSTVLVGFGKLGADQLDPTANAYAAEVLDIGTDRVTLRSVKRGKVFTMKVGGPWFRGIVGSADPVLVCPAQCGDEDCEVVGNGKFCLHDDF